MLCLVINANPSERMESAEPLGGRACEALAPPAICVGACWEVSSVFGGAGSGSEQQGIPAACGSVSGAADRGSAYGVNPQLLAPSHPPPVPHLLQRATLQDSLVFQKN